MYQNLHVNFNLGLKNTSKMKNVENLHEIHPSDSCSRADNSVIFQFWLMIMGMHHIQYVSVYIPLRYDQISKNLHVQHLLKETITFERWIKKWNFLDFFDDEEIEPKRVLSRDRIKRIPFIFLGQTHIWTAEFLSLIPIWRCRRAN